jgi:intracellular sulfur oxidation DsrE/DsrF family protein
MCTSSRDSNTRSRDRMTISGLGGIGMRSILLLTLVVSIFWGLAVKAQSADDRAALSGLKEVKIIFDITKGEAKGLSMTLSVIDETRQSLIEQGVVPYIVLAFRGPATKLIQSDRSALNADDLEYADRIAETIKGLSSASGIAAIEQCGIAVRNQDMKPENVVPGVKVVGNGWVSLAAYQAKGYSYIAP